MSLCFMLMVPSDSEKGRSIFQNKNYFVYAKNHIVCEVLKEKYLNQYRIITGVPSCLYCVVWIANKNRWRRVTMNLGKL